MPSRTLIRVRRDINRLESTIEEFKDTQPALAALEPLVKGQAALVNSNWRRYQAAAVKGDKERAERDTALGRLHDWMAAWRPIVLYTVPGAEQNVRALPPSGATPDDLIRAAGDLAQFIKENPATTSYRKGALDALGDLLVQAQKETDQANSALPAEVAARAAFTEAATAANPLVVRGSEVVRALFGAHSPQYRQFIEHSAADQQQEGADANAGEPAAAGAGDGASAGASA